MYNLPAQPARPDLFRPTPSFILTVLWAGHPRGSINYRFCSARTGRTKPAVSQAIESLPPSTDSRARAIVRPRCRPHHFYTTTMSTRFSKWSNGDRWDWRISRIYYIKTCVLPKKWDILFGRKISFSLTGFRYYTTRPVSAARWISAELRRRAVVGLYMELRHSCWDKLDTYSLPSQGYGVLLCQPSC